MRRRDRASFSPEILQAGVVKGLIQYCCTVLYSVLCDCGTAVPGHFTPVKGINTVQLYSVVFCIV